MPMRKLKNYGPTRFMAKDSFYDKGALDFVVMFIEQPHNTEGGFYNRPFCFIDWKERIIRDLFGVLKPDGCRIPCRHLRHLQHLQHLRHLRHLRL